jgi:hypothetical protein
MADCIHLRDIVSVVLPIQPACEDCLAIGGVWVHLRTCQACGGTRCCDQSPNQHARKHALSTSHPLVASAEPEERWVYCFADDAFLDY